ncbi:MAG: hypothetical protein AAFR13_10535 [Pseudomonadota bacterium]
MFFAPLQGAAMMQNAMASYWRSVDNVGKTAHPHMKAATRTQLEAGGFVAKRLRANMELPHRFARCKTPMDAMIEATSFWIEAVEDYADTTHSSFRALGFAPPTLEPRVTDWQSPIASATTPIVKPRERDLLDVKPVPPKANTQPAEEYAKAA